MLVAIILADMIMIRSLTEATDNVTTEVTDSVKTEATDNVTTGIIDESIMIDMTSMMMIDIEITEIIDETTLMTTMMKEETGKTETEMMNDDKTEPGMTDTTKITMTLGQEMTIMDELREIKRREGTTTIDDETKEIKMRGVIEATTCKENIETSMLTGGKRESVVTMVNDTIGMMIAQTLETITPDLVVKDATGMMIAQILETITKGLAKDVIGMMIAQILETITKGLAETGMTLMTTDDN